MPQGLLFFRQDFILGVIVVFSFRPNLLFPLLYRLERNVYYIVPTLHPPSLWLFASVSRLTLDPEQVRRGVILVLMDRVLAVKP